MIDIPSESLKTKADKLRLNTLKTIYTAKSGHIGASFSIIEILTTLYYSEMQKDDVFILSKGHACSALYCVLASKGIIKTNELLTFRKFGGLPGHVDLSVPGVHANTGSLGMGISKGAGHAVMNRNRNVYVLVGDGELQEGQNWEALQHAAHLKLDNLFIIVDKNKVQTDTEVQHIVDTDPMIAKFTSFGCSVKYVDGHSIEDLQAVFNAFKTHPTDRPKVIIADTVKGKGVSFMEHKQGLYKWHSRIPTEKEYKKAVREICDRLNIEPQESVKSTQNVELMGTSMKPAFSNALLKLGKRVIVMDADLSEDCGLRPFEKKYPDNFIECGIAEQHTVSMAGAIARNGKLPIVNTYTAFLTSRSNEQIYNNCSEGSKVIYVGHLAGILPAKPGKSHSGFRDISLLQSIPDLLIYAPANHEELNHLPNILLNVKQSLYLRLEHTPPRYDFNLPKTYKPKIGRGAVLAQGKDITMISYGPLMLCECLLARLELKRKGYKGSVKVISMPWINVVDFAWLKHIVGNSKVFVVENHSIHGGLSSTLRSIKHKAIGITGWPQSGGHSSILKAYGLDYQAIARGVIDG